MLLKITSLQISFKNKQYSFEPFLGLLLQKNDKIIPKTIRQNSKLSYFIELNNKPYGLLSHQYKTNNIKNKNLFIYYYAILLTKIVSFNFLLGRILTIFRITCFSNSREAIAYYRKYIYPNQQDDLCLSRTLFALATSKSFKKNGVIFIGTSLPSTSMHAWIIEDYALADPNDGIWLNYQPVAAIYYE